MKVYIDKTICKFLFIHDLSGWHYSSRKSFRDYWIRTPAKLSEKERKALIIWKKLNLDFYKKRETFILTSCLSKKLKERDRKIIDNTFKIFEPRFEFFYKKQLPNIKKVAKYLKNLKTPRYLKETYKLYGANYRNIPVYIAMSHKANRSAGGMLLDNIVVLQFGDYKLGKDNSSILNTLFHEIAHRGSIGKYLGTKPNVKLPRGFIGSAKDFIDEVVNMALWSEIGLFSQKQFGWSEQKIYKSYRFLLKEWKSPYKEIIRKAFVVRGYLAKKLKNNPNFKFNRGSVNEIVSLLRKR
jgi:hypothetical protein